MINAPCKRCRIETPDKHYIGCHADCEDYQNYVIENDRVRNAFNRDYGSIWTAGSESKKNEWKKRRGNYK